MNEKLFKSQLAALLNHHGIDNRTQTPDFVLAEFVDHCLQSFARAVQDRALLAQTTTATAASDPESDWMKSLLSKTDEVAADAAQPAPPAFRATPVKATAMTVFELPATPDDLGVMEALGAAVNAAPSPVTVKFMEDGEAHAEGFQLGQSIGILDVNYTILAITPDGSVLLARKARSSLSI